MSIFDFFKKRNNEDLDEVRKIKLGELPEWINSLSIEAQNNSKGKLNEIREKINGEKSKLNANIDAICDAELKNKDIPDRMKHIMDGNRKIYLSKIDGLVKEIEVPDEFEALWEFVEDFDKTMDDFSKSIVKSHHVMSEFFVKEAGMITVNIKKIDQLVKQIKGVVEESGFRKFEEMRIRILDIQSKVNRKDEVEEEIKSLRREISEKEKEVKVIEKNVRSVEASADHKDFLKLVDEKKSLEEEVDVLGKKFVHSFFELEAGLKRYINLNKEDNLARSYLENPLGALSEDKNLEVVGLVAKIKTYILEGSIELKDKKKDSVLEEIAKLNKSYFDDFVSERDSMVRKINEINDVIAHAGIVSKVERARVELENAMGSLDSKKEEAENLALEFEGIDVGGLKLLLAGEINEGIGKKVLII